MDKISPLLLITDSDPVPEPVVSASGWYTTETHEHYQYWRDEDKVAWLIAQGWYVTQQTNYPTADPPYTFYRLERRRLLPERALSDLVSQFTSAYNEGRTINDQRYDEIVAVYAAMLDKGQDEFQLQRKESRTYEDLAETLIASVGSDYSTYSSAQTGALSTWGDSQRDAVETQFDNLLAARRADLISRGLYNTTLWESISAGIERERAKALNVVEDQILARQVELTDRVYARQVEMRRNVQAAGERLHNLMEEGRLKMLDMRNRILGAMLNFMERRQDEYPGLENLGELASKLGMGETTGVVP